MINNQESRTQGLGWVINANLHDPTEVAHRSDRAGQVLSANTVSVPTNTSGDSNYDDDDDAKMFDSMPKPNGLISPVLAIEIEDQL